MRSTDAVIIGGGQAGLVMSRSLAAFGIDHVVLERGRIGERWHAQRSSMNLLTTNALSALPGLPHASLDPDAFMTAGAFAAYLDRYAVWLAAPVLGGVTVDAVEAVGRGYRISTNAGEWRSRVVVVATGACDTPFRPAMAQALAPAIFQIDAADFRTPGQLPAGGALVVGASATGVQLAEEIHASGRPVTLAVGDHTRVPRRYRGRDIYARMEMAGILDDPALETRHPGATRHAPSLQLVGSSDNRDLDLGVLARQGVRLLGRLAAIDGAKAQFAGDLERTTRASHERMVRLLERIDDIIWHQEATAPAAEPSAGTAFAAAGAPLTLDLERQGIASVVWATGYARSYPWLKVPVLSGRGEILHRGGVTAAPGLYALGLSFLRRRRSSFISGCGLDAGDLAPIIRRFLNDSIKKAA